MNQESLLLHGTDHVGADVRKVQGGYFQVDYGDDELGAKLADFIYNCIDEFIELANSCGIIKDGEIDIAYENLSFFIETIQFSSDLDNQAAVVCPGKISINSQLFFEEFRNASSTHDPVFDTSTIVSKEGLWLPRAPLKKSLFHELFHLLQYGQLLGGFYKQDISGDNEVGIGMMELAAALAEEKIWAEYLKKKKGHENAGVIMAKFSNSIGSIISPSAVEDKDKLHTDSHTNGYARIASIGVRLLHAINIQGVDLMRASTMLEPESQRVIIEKYEAATGIPFKEFSDIIDQMTIRLREGLEEKDYHKMCQLYGLAIRGMVSPFKDDQQDASYWIIKSLSLLSPNEYDINHSKHEYKNH